MRLFMAWLVGAGVLAAQSGRPTLVRDVRAALNQGQEAAAQELLESYRRNQGEDGYWLEAFSWLGRARLAAGAYGEAMENADRTRRKALAMLQGRRVDDIPGLSIALGASIEVHAQSLNAEGQKSEAVAFLQEELERWKDTSIRTRIQKNLHLITLEGKPAPALEAPEWIGGQRPDPSSWQNRPRLYFFWAHWCGDCKKQGPILARLTSAFGPRGLLLVAPTQRYGYVARGEEAPPEREKEYIAEVFREHYASLRDAVVPLSEENFRMWGASTTPTLVLVDRQGTVRLYHPGLMEEEELRERLRDLF